MPLGATRDNPIPFGTGITSNKSGLSFWVEEVIEDATQIVLDKNQFNDPPVPGNQFVIIRIKVKNNSPDPKNYDADRLHAVGNSSVEYKQSGDGRCGVIPNEFDTYRNLFEGGELSGNVCFSVKSSDVASLVMYDKPYFGNKWTFFALR